MAAWAGLVPRQFSTGGKTVLGSITKRGDSYLRGLLTQGARSAVQSALKRKPEKRSHLEQWIVALHGRVGYHKDPGGHRQQVPAHPLGDPRPERGL